MRLVPRSVLLSSVLTALMAVAVPEAMTQEQPATPPTTFPQGQLEAFADAAVELQRVQTELDADLQKTDNAQEAARLQQEAQDKATRAVEAEGLTTDEYMAIVQAAEQDPALYAMITDLMQQRVQ